MSSALRFPSSAAVVTQEELNHWFGIRNSIEQLKVMQVKLERELLERLACGAECEPGAHSATIHTRYSGSRRITRVEIH